MPKPFTPGFPEYCIEAFCLGTFMMSAVLFTALLELPSSRLHQAIPSDLLRRGLIGMAMGLTAVVLIYSPWGKRSGAHMNPSVTVTFWHLGKIQTRDAFFYILFQFVGGWLGVVISAFLLGKSAVSHPSVAYAITIPGPKGAPFAWWAEFAISYLLMTVVLRTSNSALAPETGIFAGCLIFLYILFEAPYSGMSMNPARTLGSAIPAHQYNYLWIYFTAPPSAMFLAGEIYRRTHHTVHARMAFNSERH